MVETRLPAEGGLLVISMQRPIMATTDPNIKYDSARRVAKTNRHVVAFSVGITIVARMMDDESESRTEVGGER